MLNKNFLVCKVQSCRTLKKLGFTKVFCERFKNKILTFKLFYHTVFNDLVAILVVRIYCSKESLTTYNTVIKPSIIGYQHAESIILLV